MKEQQKKNFRNCIVFTVLISAFLLVFSAAIILDILFPCVLLDNRLNIISVLAQIQITIFALTVTVISISTSLLKDEIYGVPVKDIFKLRKNLTISLLSVMIILFGLTALMVLAIIFKLFITSIVLTISTILIGIWSSLQDLPICFKNDKALIDLLKKNVQTKQDGINDLELQNKLLLGMLYSKKLDKVCQLLKTNNPTKNKELFDRLMTIITNELTNLPYYTDVPELKLKVNNSITHVLENIKRFLEYDNKLIEEYSDADNVSLHLMRILFYIHEHENQMDVETKTKFENYISNLFFKLYVLNDDEKSFEFKTLHHLLRWSLRECDMWFVTLLQKEYSKWHYSFNEHKSVSILFCEISFVMFVYYNYENLLSKEKKDLIKKQIQEPITISTTERILPWRYMFNEFIEKFDLSFDDLTKNIDPNAWEFMLMNECKSCILTDRSLASWWFMCFISSENLYKFNFEALNELDEKSKRTLVNYLDLLFTDNSKEIKTQQQFNDFKNTFSIHDDKLQHINQFSRVVDKLYEFKNTYKKDQELSEAINNDINNNDHLNELASYLKNSLINKLNKSPFLDKSISLENVQAKGFFNIEEMFDLENAKSLYFDMIHRCYQYEFIKIYDEHFKNKYISFDEKTTEKKLNDILKIKPTLTSSKELSALNRLSHLNKDIVSKVVSIDDNINTIKDITLPNNYYTNNMGVKFNYEIFIFELKELTDDELQRCVDNQKSDNGTYFYNGIQYEFNELFELFKKKYFTIKVYLKYKFIFNDKNIVKIDPWGYEERKRSRKRTD